jgi:hypothetical protein
MALYMIIANQGYETSYIRYYYFIIPSLVLFISVFIYRLAKTILYKRKITHLVVILIILIGILTFHINYALTESNSVIIKNSVNIIKNVDSLDAFDKIKLVNKSRVIVDRQMSLPFYIYFNVLPAHIAIDSKMVQKSTGSINSYLNISELDYTEIFNQRYTSDADYLIFSYMITEISEDTIEEVNKNAEWAYNTRFIYIYKLKSLPPNNSSYKI